jgi:hypothetical protein
MLDHVAEGVTGKQREHHRQERPQYVLLFW